MEAASSMDDTTAVVASTTPLAASIWQDVLAQAITGELIASMNYESLAEICTDAEEKADALEHAASERGHAAAFANEGRKLSQQMQDTCSFRYGLINIGGRDKDEILQVFEHCKQKLTFAFEAA